MKEKKQSGDFFTNLFKWKMEEKELQNQIENYNTLGFFGSARKVATALMIFSAIITLIWALSENWVDIALVLILAFFIYKGKGWAMIVAMIYWTYSKGFQLVSGFFAEDFSASSVIMPIIWWAIFMGAFWQAYQVEKERKKISYKNESILIGPKKFCRHCGKLIDTDSKFCTSCGNKS